MAKDKNILAHLLCILVCICTVGQGALAQDTRQRVIDTALSQVGVREASGHNDGVAVEKYLMVCGLGKGHAWCAAFVTWVFHVNGVTTFKSAWAPAWFPQHRLLRPGQTPQPGDVFGLWIDNRIGHVGLIQVWGERVVITIEGNTNDAGSREGDGVYRKRRLKRQINRISNWVN